jgi:hypothetical protein
MRSTSTWGLIESAWPLTPRTGPKIEYRNNSLSCTQLCSWAVQVQKNFEVSWFDPPCAARKANEHEGSSMHMHEIESIMWLTTSFYVVFYYEYYYSPHKLAFQNVMRAGDQKLMINLEWPNNQ